MHQLQKEIYKQGYNIYDFASKAGVTRNTLYYIFNNKYSKTRGDTIYLISKALNKSFEETEELCRNENRDI